MHVNEQAESITWWLVWRFSFYGNGFRFLPFQVHLGIRLSVCNSVRSILIVLLGDVIFDSDRLWTTFRENWRQYIKIRGVLKQCVRIGFSSAMYWHWKLLCIVITEGLYQQCFRIGYGSAMLYIWELICNVLRWGITQHWFRIGYTSAIYWNWELLCHVIK